MREAPSLALIDALASWRDCHRARPGRDARSTARDRRPHSLRRLELRGAEGADALVVVTDWNEYRHPDFGRMKEALRKPIVIDGRNLYDREKMASMGFTYDSVGRRL